MSTKVSTRPRTAAKPKLKSSIAPETVTVEAGGKSFVIGRFDTGQTFSLIEPFFEVYEQLQASNGTITPPRLIGKCPGAVYAMLATATNETPDFIKRLPPNETLRLLNALLETNMDFFTDQVQPEFVSVVGKLFKSAPKTR